jgi:hypothetical protein
MNIGLDIDGTITDHPAFFALLSQAFRAAGHRVLIFTYRDPERAAHARAELAGWGVEFDDLVFAPSLAAKGELCRRYDVAVFIDDQDECIADVPESTMVLKVRNGGNFDFVTRRWVSTARLTRLL